jgi:DNA-binding response OmpR family regulator
MKREKVLAIEDEADILEVIDYNLSRAGYRVLKARDGEEGLKLARRESPDIVLVDLMLPGVDGIEICRQLKRDPVTRLIPIMIVTAKSEEVDVVLGLGVGADDYVTKPFSPRELVARVEAMLRRGPLKSEAGQGERVVRGDLVIDLSRHEVVLQGKPVNFTRTELRLLHFLASHPGRVFDRNHLLSRVIGEAAIVTDRNIDVHVRAIRGKLGQARDLIETVRGVGYRFRSNATR